MSEDRFIEKLMMFEDHIIERVRNEVLFSLESKFDRFTEKYNQDRDYTFGLLKRLDEDRIFTYRWFERIEDELSDQKNQIAFHEKEIEKIKKDLNIR